MNGRSPSPEWKSLCAAAKQSPPRDEVQIRDWLMRNLQPYRVESSEGTTSGLMTGYYEPMIEARRASGGTFRVALHAPPADLAARQPYWTRQQLDTLPAGQASWPAIKEWAQRNPGRIDELLWVNPRYVFFREEPLPDPTVGPRGAQGVPLTPVRCAPTISGAGVATLQSRPAARPAAR